MAVTSFMQAFQDATQEDLDQINKQIGDIEGELSCLKSARKLLLERFTAKEVGGEVRQQSAQGAKMARTRGLRQKLLTFLSAAGTAQKKAAIVQTLAMEDGEFEHLTNHGWFKIGQDGYVSLSSAGRDQVG